MTEVEGSVIQKSELRIADGGDSRIVGAHSYFHLICAQEMQNNVRRNGVAQGGRSEIFQGLA